MKKMTPSRRRMSAPIVGPISVGLAALLLAGCGGGSSETATAVAPAAAASAPVAATLDVVEVLVGEQTSLAAADSTEPAALTVLSTPGNDTSEPKAVQ